MFKKINIKSMIVGMVIGIVLCSSVFADVSSIQVLFNNIKVSLDGVILEMKDAKGNVVEPLVYNGTTYLPARALCETLGKDIKMNEITNVLEITTRKEDVTLMSEVNTTEEVIDINSYIIQIDNKDYIDADYVYRICRENGCTFGYNRITLNASFSKVYEVLAISTNVVKQNDNYYLDYEFYQTTILPVINK